MGPGPHRAGHGSLRAGRRCGIGRDSQADPGIRQGVWHPAIFRHAGHWPRAADGAGPAAAGHVCVRWRFAFEQWRRFWRLRHGFRRHRNDRSRGDRRDLGARAGHGARELVRAASCAGVVAKDVMLVLCRELGMDNAFRAIEYGGETVAAMSMSERAVLCNMAAELGAETGLVEADATTLEAIRAAGQEPAADALRWRSDADAAYLASHEFDAAALAPQVAAPHSPANSGAALRFPGYTDRPGLHRLLHGGQARGSAHGRRGTEGPARGEWRAIAAWRLLPSRPGPRPPRTGRWPQSRRLARPFCRPVVAPARRSGPACSPTGKCASPPRIAISRDAWAPTRRRYISVRHIPWPPPPWRAASRIHGSSWRDIAALRVPVDAREFLETHHRPRLDIR